MALLTTRRRSLKLRAKEALAPKAMRAWRHLRARVRRLRRQMLSGRCRHVQPIPPTYAKAAARHTVSSSFGYARTYPPSAATRAAWIAWIDATLPRAGLSERSRNRGVSVAATCIPLSPSRLLCYARCTADMLARHRLRAAAEPPDRQGWRLTRYELPRPREFADRKTTTGLSCSSDAVELLHLTKRPGSIATTECARPPRVAVAIALRVTC